MSKLERFSAVLIAVATFATPAMAREPKSWHDKNGAQIEASSVVRVGKRNCIRAPDVGAFASAPYKQPPCVAGIHPGTDTSPFGATTQLFEAPRGSGVGSVSACPSVAVRRTSMRRAGVTFLASPPDLVATLTATSAPFPRSGRKDTLAVDDIQTRTIRGAFNRCLLAAPNRHAAVVAGCPFLGVKPTSGSRVAVSESDPQRKPTLVQRELAEIVATDRNFTLW